MSKFIKMQHRGFQELMLALQAAGRMMAKDGRTKKDDERWGLFCRIVNLCARYDRRFQNDKTETSSPHRTTKSPRTLYKDE